MMVAMVVVKIKSNMMVTAAVVVAVVLVRLTVSHKLELLRY